MICHLMSFDNFVFGAVAIRYVLLLVWGAFYQCRYPLANSWHCNALQCIAKVKVISLSYPYTGNHAMASVNSTVCCGKCGKCTFENGLHHFSAMARYIYPIPSSPQPLDQGSGGLVFELADEWWKDGDGRPSAMAKLAKLAKLVTRELFEL